MIDKLVTITRYGIMALVIAVGFSQIILTAQDEKPPERSLEGVWDVTIRPRNCATGEPIPTAVSKTIWTFHSGGTMSVWAQNATITTTRSTSFGLWKQDHGWSNYSYKFVHLRYNLTTGAFVGKQE